MTWAYLDGVERLAADGFAPVMNDEGKTQFVVCDNVPDLQWAYLLLTNRSLYRRNVWRRKK